ncbi:MAG: putative phosphatase [Pseudomonadota bacterium]|jgi:pyrophosphatase PpaX
MRYRTALFDFDGTLTPSLPLWVKAFRIAIERHGIVMTDEEVIQKCFFRDWSDIAAELKIGSGDRLRDLVTHEGLREAFAEAELFPLAKAVIEHCRAHGMQTALVTSAPKSMIQQVIPQLELHDLFDHTVCAEDVGNLKPHPEPVLMALAAIGQSPSEAIMIGDSTVDMLSGRTAGTHTALFLPPGPSPFHDVDALHATQPDYVFGHHRELPAILGLPAIS